MGPILAPEDPISLTCILASEMVLTDYIMPENVTIQLASCYNPRHFPC